MMSSRNTQHATHTRSAHLASCILLLAILLLAAGLRFCRLDWVEYKLDEANISRLALNMVRTGRVPIWGIGSSVGIYNGALSVWLLAIPYAVSSSPLVATGCVAALNVLAVAMTFAFTRKVAGPAAGLIAALLFAVAPWAVLNSRKLWAQDLLPPFVIAYLWTAYLALVEKKRWWLVGHVLALAACIQLHYSALTLVFLTVFLILLFWWRRWSWKVLLVVTVVGVLGFAPFLYLDAITLARDSITGQAHTFPNFTRIMQTVLYRKAVVDTTAFQMAWSMVTGNDLHSLAGASEFRNYLSGLLPVAPLFAVLGVLVLVALGWALRRAARAWNDAQAKAGFVVAMGMVFPILLFVWHSTPVFPHYFILLYPWPYVLVAMFIAWLAQQRPRWRVAGWGGALIAVIAVAQVYSYLSIIQFVAGRNTPGGYGTPVGLTLRAVRSAEQVAREMKGNILVMADGDNVEADEVASIWDVLVDPAFASRVVDRRQAMVYPSAPAAVVYAPGASGETSVTHIPLRRGEGEYSLVQWSGGDVPTAKAHSVSPVGPDRWANGVQLLAAQPSGDVRAGGKFRWQLTWHVNSPPPPDVDYHWTNQLYDAAGKRVGQMDGVGFPARSWRAGDTVVTWFDIPVAPEAAPGVYQMRVGMYTYPDIKTILVVDGPGYVEVGPVEIK